MNAPQAPEAGAGTTDLATLASPSRLVRPARLYGVVLDAAGNAGVRGFLAALPAGACIFPLAAPGVSFLLREQGLPDPSPLFMAFTPDAAGIEPWYAALLAAPGFAPSDAHSVLLPPGEKRSFAAGSAVTARSLTWLTADQPILAYAATHSVEASPGRAFLAMANQTRIDIVGEGEVAATDTAGFVAGAPPEVLGELTATLARRIAAALIAHDTHRRQRWRQTLEVDEARAIDGIERLRNIASLSGEQGLTKARPGEDPLRGALGVLGATEGFTLRVPRDDDVRAPLFERLKAYSVSSGFRYREIALDGEWWKEEGPPFLAVDATTGSAIAIVGRRRRWRTVDPVTLAEKPVDAAMASKLLPTGYMLYPSLPDTPKGRDIYRFGVFGAGRDIGWLVTASALASLAALLMPVATGSILGIAIPDGRMTLLLDMLLLLVAAAVGSVGFQVARALSLIRLGTHLDQRLQAAVWDRVVRLRTSFFRQYQSGDLTNRILGIDWIRRTLTGQAVNAMIGGVFSLGGLGIMLIYDATLAAFAFVYALVAALMLFFVGRVQRNLQRQMYNQEGMVYGLLIEMIGGIAKLRVAAAELRAFSRWSRAFARQRASSAGALRLNAIQTVTSTSLPFIGALGVYAIAGGGSNPIDVASFAAFNAAFGQFTAAFLGLANALNASIDVLPLYARVKPVFEAPLEVERHRADPGPLGGDVAVRNLWFRYADNGPWVLEDVSFEVRPGESVAIVGASGSGKSTILRLLLGLEPATRGGVFYDGKELEELDLRLVRRQIGSVMEGSSLFPGSLHENIAGSAPLSREQVMEAVRMAGLEADIAAMPMGLNSAITEGGSQISGGQRQRVMIARALASRPRLLFFDEATSALDNTTQAIVAESLSKMNATRIVIAHRLSTIRNVDRIVVLDAGRVVETGKYDELIEKRGTLYTLAQRQLL
ncbi:MAG: NHLP bacteriocin export ABC transporter permease/ATPase subunit [Reyranella sp.]|nr:MAG: NHLP bacteriocin export ABC transporter permease/ATPase subunit [Reyranella sp.]